MVESALRKSSSNSSLLRAVALNNNSQLISKW